MRTRLDVGWWSASLAVAWLAGVGLHLRQATLPAPGVDAALLAAAALLGVAAWRGRHHAVVALLAALAAALGAGFSASGVEAARRLADALPPALEGRDLEVVGVVATLPQRSASGLRFRFDVESARWVGGATADRASSGRRALRSADTTAASQAAPAAPRVPAMLSLGWYRGLHEDAAAAQPASELRAGQRWRFTVRLRRPHGNLNPHGNDHELTLFEQGVRATGYVRDAPAPALLERAAGHPIERLRQRVRDAIEASVPDRRAAGVLSALAVGDQGAIDRDDWELYRTTGIAHLVSISGLHITMFAWLAGGAIGALWRRSPRAMLRWPAPTAARVGGLACAAAYAVFSGWGVPSQRTIWMLAVVVLARSLGVRWPWPMVLLAAAVVVTALDPWALLQVCFWLSFAAVGLLMASAGSERRDARRPDSAVEDAAAAPGLARRGAERLRRIGFEAVRTQAIATIGLTPLALVFFQQVSLVGFAANLIAIPLVTLVITPLALLGVLLTPLWTLGAWVVQRLDAVLVLLASVPQAVWTTPAAPPWAQLAGLLGAVVLMLPLPWRARLLALPLLVPLLWPARDLPADGDFDLAVLDVGQGTAVLVRTRDHLLVFDAGPQYGRDSDAGQRVLLPLLRARGEHRIDRLVLSHRDNDHVGGAAALLKALPVASLWSSLEDGHALLRAAGPVAERCVAGQAWDWDGVRFTVLRPPAADYARALKSNAMSCVVRVEGGGRSVLLTGDIERDQEAALVAADAAVLRSDVLLVPHHGSKTSSSAALLDAVQPRLALVQAGYRNRFGHPAPEVIARYAERGIAVVDTASCGAWQWRRDTPEGRCRRDEARRYWHDPSPGAPAPPAIAATAGR